MRGDEGKKLKFHWKRNCFRSIMIASTFSTLSRISHCRISIFIFMLLPFELIYSIEHSSPCHWTKYTIQKPYWCWAKVRAFGRSMNCVNGLGADVLWTISREGFFFILSLSLLGCSVLCINTTCISIDGCIAVVAAAAAALRALRLTHNIPVLPHVCLLYTLKHPLCSASDVRCVSLPHSLYLSVL